MYTTPNLEDGVRIGRRARREERGIDVRNSRRCRDCERKRGERSVCGYCQRMYSNRRGVWFGGVFTESKSTAETQRQNQEGRGNHELAILADGGDEGRAGGGVPELEQ